MKRQQGGKRQEEERVSNRSRRAQCVRHLADSFRFEHKMPTDQEKLRIDQDTFGNVNTTMALPVNIKC